MSTIRSINTRIIKPLSVSTLNNRPCCVNTGVFAGYIDLNETNRYGSFKYNQGKYGSTTEYSVNQAMPKLDTREI